jgi:farnesyl diphosphate synthase
MTNPSEEDFQRRLKAHAEALETVLDGLLAFEVQGGEISRPARLVEAMRYSVLGGGKRLRPFLLIETARLAGCEARTRGVLRAAAALELVHCYSLVHDDLPAMDNDDFRRGKASLHRAFDEATAILAGDALLTLAFDVLADPSTHRDPEVRTGLVSGLAKAAGLGGMVGGQVYDMAKSDYRAILIRMKTAALFRFAAEAGCLFAKAEAETRKTLTRFGEVLGTAFQLADDIADKDAGVDPRDLAQQIGEAVAILLPFGAEGEVLQSLVEFVVAPVAKIQR